MKILCITGTRADYGIYRPLLQAIEKDNELNLSMVVTGMHLLSEYGMSIQEIQKDGHHIVATPNILPKGDTTAAMSQATGLFLLYCADIFACQQPDFILLLGDRLEMLAAAIAAHYQNIGIIHLHGGEISGSADDLTRHALSRFAHLHFVSTLRAQERLQTWGEEAWRIKAVGSLRKTDIDRIMILEESLRETYKEKYLSHLFKKTIVFLIHPDSKEVVPFHTQINTVLSALNNLDAMIIIIGSNSDAGGSIFTQCIKQFIKKNKFAQFFPTIPHDEYLYLLQHADVIIGNSSSGIIEAPFFNLPCINIGLRQNGREKAANVTDVGYDTTMIRDALRNILKSTSRSILSNPYNLNKSPETEIIKTIKKLSRHPGLLMKQYSNFQ
ncbi:MAG: UDP-N-acetylglucosamine 2-epimerase (hydrolyzing) [Clostridiales bacterium]|jgi:UDP-hydrolysing UDP-N-acetyl-D-glucosamine 2-epimerase|nr:UDP-N-acetylglucosamine 2-epimerase (hydrolyzing) [Clostridiales bacterium]